MSEYIEIGSVKMKLSQDGTIHPPQDLIKEFILINGRKFPLSEDGRVQHLQPSHVEEADE